MSDQHPDGRIKLRCNRCGHMRRPIIGPHLPDGIDVALVCDECIRRSMARFVPDEPDRPWRTIARDFPPLPFKVLSASVFMLPIPARDPDDPPVAPPAPGA